jgi:hypothetical protein
MAAIALLAPACSTTEPPLPAPRTKVIEVGPLHIDRIYPSMFGPFARVDVDLSDLNWITAFRTEVVDVDSREPIGEEFLCHTQLQLPDEFRPIVTATGITEIRFPEGFGMPLRLITAPFREDPHPLTFFGMVLNNHDPAIDRMVNVRATIEYLTREDVGDPPRLRKLFRASLPMTVEDLALYSGPKNPDVATHCDLVGKDNNHWMVPPGPQITRKRYSGDFLLHDVTVHYGVVHLHNHARDMRLTDVTTGDLLWQTDVVYEPDRLQIAKIPAYSSTEGFAMKVDHEYEIEAFYENATDQPIDAMAMMSLYYHPSVPDPPWFKDLQ